MFYSGIELKTVARIFNIKIYISWYLVKKACKSVIYKDDYNVGVTPCFVLYILKLSPNVDAGIGAETASLATLLRPPV